MAPDRPFRMLSFSGGIECSADLAIRTRQMLRAAVMPSASADLMRPPPGVDSASGWSLPPR
jgi:hypothetical protein